MKKYVISRGPNVGKTTALELLALKGYAVVPESARIIIDTEKEYGAGISPSNKPDVFQQKVFDLQIKNEQTFFIQFKENEVIFLDRSLADGIAYCLLGNIPIPENIRQGLESRYDIVFVLDPLGDLMQEKLRFEKIREGERIHKKIIEVYMSLGYQITFVPPLSPQERVDFILHSIASQ